MPNINIKVAGKIATNLSPGVPIVCGNSDYTVTFDLDDEWAGFDEKTARFNYKQAGAMAHIDVPVMDGVVTAPVFSDAREVYVGLYATGRATTPARILCDRAILCAAASMEF